jgi:hypothetical protein
MSILFSVLSIRRKNNLIIRYYKMEYWNIGKHGKNKRT